MLPLASASPRTGACLPAARRRAAARRVAARGGRATARPRPRRPRGGARSTARSAALTAGIRPAAMLSSRTPSPASSTAASGSPASSPHTPTQRPCASAAAHDRADQREHRRQRARRAARRARALPRSAAIVYCARSFVPMEKKSTCGATRSAASASAGHLDHHADLERAGRARAPRARASSRARAASSSSSVATIGNISGERMLGGHAHDGAQLGVEQLRLGRARGGCRARRGTGCPPAPGARKGSGLSAPASSVRTTSGRPSSARGDLAQHGHLLVLVRRLGAVEEEELRAQQADPLGALGQRRPPPRPPSRGSPTTSTRRPVARRGRLAARGASASAAAASAAAPAALPLGEHRRVGGDVDGARVAVEGQLGALRRPPAARRRARPRRGCRARGRGSRRARWRRRGRWRCRAPARGRARRRRPA